jgi:Tol biopolymer transport system component
MRGRGGIAGLLVVLTLVAPAAAESVPDGGFALMDRPTGLGTLPFDRVSESFTSAHAISADGRYVVFSSKSDLLLPDDVDSAQNVYRLDRTTGVIDLVSATAAGVPAQAGSVNENATISADGRYVAFTSRFSNLHPAAASDANAILVKDMQVKDVRLASRATGADGAAAAGASNAVISGDGRSAVFTNVGSFDGENADGSNDTDVYVRNLDTEKTWRATVPASGGSNDGSIRDTPDINRDGTALAIVTTSGLIAADTDDTADAYLIRAVQSSPVPSRLSGILAVHDAAISHDGTRVAWTTNAV